MPRNEFSDDDRRDDDRDPYRYDERGRLVTRGLDERRIGSEAPGTRRGGWSGGRSGRDADYDRERRIREEARWRAMDDDRSRMRQVRDDSSGRALDEREDVASRRGRIRYGYSGGSDFRAGEGPRYDRFAPRREELDARRAWDRDDDRREPRSRGTLRSSDKVLAVDVMTEVLSTVLPDTSVIEAARAMRDGDVGALPVVDAAGHPLGVITDRDIVCRMVAEDEDIARAQVHASMTDEVYACNADDTLDEVYETMSRHQVRRLLVVDRHDRLIGIISQADIARHAARHQRTDEPREVAETIGRISRPGGPHS